MAEVAPPKEIVQTSLSPAESLLVQRLAEYLETDIRHAMTRAVYACARDLLNHADRGPLSTEAGALGRTLRQTALRRACDQVVDEWRRRTLRVGDGERQVFSPVTP